MVVKVINSSIRRVQFTGNEKIKMKRVKHKIYRKEKPN